MAQTVFDILGNAPKVQASPLDSGARAQDIAATAASGKEQADGSGAQASRLGEAGALQTLADQLDQVKSVQETATAGQQQQLRQIDTQAGLQNKQIDVAELSQRQEYTQKTSSLLQEFSQGKSTLDLQKNGAKLEQLGFNLRMSDDKYIFNLQQEGDRARLDNKLAFQEQLNAQVFGDLQGLAEDDAAFAKMMSTSQADFDAFLQDMTQAQAERIAREEERAAARSAPFKVLTAGVSAVTGFMGSAKASNPTTADGPVHSSEYNANADLPSYGAQDMATGRIN